MKCPCGRIVEIVKVSNGWQADAFDPIAIEMINVGESAFSYCTLTKTFATRQQAYESAQQIIKQHTCWKQTCNLFASVPLEQK